MTLMQMMAKHRPVWAPEEETGSGDDTVATGDDTVVAGEDTVATGEDTVAAADYSFIPEDFRKDGEPDLEGFKAHLEELQATKAQRDEALADVPEDASGYEFAIPDDLDLSGLDLGEDFTMELKADDPAVGPLLSELGEIMHRYSMPKSAAKDMMTMLAKYEATTASEMRKGGAAKSEAEIKKLGSSGKARMANVQRTLESRLSKDQAKSLMGATMSAEGVKALEALLKPRGMAPPSTASISSDVEGLTPFQKLQRANEQAR